MNADCLLNLWNYTEDRFHFATSITIKLITKEAIKPQANRARLNEIVCQNRSWSRCDRLSLVAVVIRPGEGPLRRCCFLFIDRLSATGYRGNCLWTKPRTWLRKAAMESGATVDDIVNELAETARCLQESARCRGITLADAVREILGSSKPVSLTAGERGA